MPTHATGIFEVKSRNEQAYAQMEGGRRLTVSTVAQAFTGDIEGEGSFQSLTCYREDGTGDFVGMQVVVGRLADRAGSFVLQFAGSFDGQQAEATWAVVPGSGTGELAGLRGEGTLVAPEGPTASLTLDYYFEDEPDYFEDEPDQ